MSEVVEIDVEAIIKSLDYQCYYCKGSGVQMPDDCDFCAGSGFQTTEAGDALIDFLKRHAKELKSP